MGFLGRAIFPSRIIIAQLDTAAIRAAGNYDDDLREIKRVDADGDGIGEEQREEVDEIVVMGQVATRGFERQDQQPGGAVLETPNLEITFHMRDLEEAALLADDGRALVQVGTRLVRIDDKAGKTIVDFPNPPGMFCTAARPSGFLGVTRNLWVCTFSDRRQAAGEPRTAQV